MKKILYISGNRADYGLMATTLEAIDEHEELNIEIAVTGMHMSEAFGLTVNEIKKGNFKIHEIKEEVESDDKESMARFIGKLIQSLTSLVQEIKPDIILLLGDRGEMLAGAITGAYLSIPVAHVHGGDVSSTVDETARHAITKLSNIHFPATEKSAERIIKLGENPSFVFMVGAPGLDGILNSNLIDTGEITDKYNLDSSKPILLVTQHPVTSEVENAGDQMRQTLEAARELDMQTIVIYPNSDAGGRKIIEVIEGYNDMPLIQCHKNIPRIDYLSLMNISSVMVGNSSSGIIEAPSFGLPVINIGSRQKGRERANNVMDVDFVKENIKEAIEKALNDKAFLELVEKAENPYGDGNAGHIIADILSKVKIDSNLLVKKITY